PDYGFFTGSSTVAKKIARACYTHLIEYTLQLGGQCPAYLHPDADLTTSASRTDWGTFLTAGQTCVAPNDTSVQEALSNELTSAIIEELTRQFGTYHAAKLDYPKMITSDHCRAVTELLAKTRGTIAYGGDSNPAKRHIDPTVVTNVNDDDELMSRELFGPILPIVKVTGADDAVKRIADREHPLAFYLFTQSQDIKDYMLPNVVADGVAINATL